jgi:outer membrane protein TolC
VLNKALTNSTHALKQNLKLQQSQRALAQAKSAKGLQATLSAHLGFSQTGDRIGEAYQNLREREVVGISFRLPIYDWEMSKGKVKMAQADLAVTQTEIEQADLEFRQDITTKVVRFNNQLRQCEISARAKSIAEERYKISKNRFENGMLTVTELNTAQNEYDAALSQYINQLQVFWSAYYELQKIALYDFIHKIDLSADFNKIVDNLK